jgi:hypothetical protein
MKKQIELVFCLDPMFFGGSDVQTEFFAYNLNKNLEKFFNIKSNYSLNKTGNTYCIVNDSDFGLQIAVSEFIENNWHKVK